MAFIINIMIFLFDFTGEYIECGDLGFFSHKYKIKERTILSAIERRSLVERRFYFQNTSKFIKPNKKIGVNPLDSKTNYNRKFGEKYKKKERKKMSATLYMISPEMLNDFNAKLDAIHSLLVNKINPEKNGSLKKWLTEKEAQRELGKGTTSLWKLRKSGIIKSSKLGGKTFYDIDAINEYLNSTTK